VRDDTAAVWCGLSQYDFKHEPTPKDLLHGLDTAYRQELERRGWDYPDLDASAPAGRADSVTFATRYGPVEIPWAAREALLEEIRHRGSGEFVGRVLDSVGASRPVSPDRKGKIVVLDGIWGVAERAGGDLDPKLQELRDKLTDEITQGLG
jgi:hypothetical protein